PMIAAAREVVDQVPMKSRPKLLAVTILTSLNQETLEEIGFRREALSNHVERLAKYACDGGADGIVCSPEEGKGTRAVVPKQALIVVPGIRLKSGNDDQKRTGSAPETVQAGATHLVVGRPILEAKDPKGMFSRICQDMMRA